MARGDLIDVGYGQMASPRTMCKSGFVWRYANTSQEAINTNSDIIEIFPYILRTATNYTPYSNDLRNSYVQITIGSTTITQNLKSKYNFGNVSPTDKKFYLTSEYNSSNPFGYGTPDSTTYVTTRTIDSKTAYGARFTVPHNADGSAPTVSVKWHMTNSSSHSDIEKTQPLTLDTIPRTSKPTCSNVTLGSSVTINTNRASTSFTHTINIKVGGTTRETFNNVGASQSWSPSYSIYLPIISGTSATATIECITYSGSTNIGTASTTCVITVPDNATTKPTASISIAKGDNVVPASWGVYVKGKSKLAVTISGTPKAGTSIASYSSTANGSTYTTSTYTTAELTGSGSVTGFVKDARGFQSANATPVSYTVVDYLNPQITTNTVARCTSNGTLSDEGTYVKYSFVGSISSVSNKNSKTFTLKYKEKNASSWTTIATWTSAYTLNQVDVVYGSGNIDITKEYVFRFEATDSFTTTAKEVEVGTVADLMNFNPSGKSMAIGGVSTRGATESVVDFMTNAQFKNVVVDSIKTTNLLNPNTLINGTVSASNGAYSYINYVVVSDYIPVSANKSYTIKLNNITNNQYLFRIVLYTASKAYSSTLFTGSEATQKTFASTINGYVRICFGMNGYAVLSPSSIAQANPQFEQSSTATAYKPFIEFGTDNFKNEEIVVGSIRSKNIYNPSTMPLKIGLWQSNGKIVTNAAGNYVVVPIKGGTTYSISRKYDNTTSGIQFLIATTANYPVVNESLLSYQNSSTNKQYTFTTPSNAKYLWLGLLGSGSPTEQQKAQAIDELQVETGLTSTNYMPYQNLDIQDSGWQNLTLLNGVTSRGSNYTPQYRRIGSFVYLRGQVTIPAHNSMMTMAILPEGFRPTMESKMLGLTSNNWIDTNGNLWSGADTTERNNQVLQCLIIVD